MARDSARAYSAHRARWIVRMVLLSEPCAQRMASRRVEGQLTAVRGRHRRVHGQTAARASGSRKRVWSRMLANPLDVYRDGALAGHVALVTGGGTGICRGIARAYAALGADVCIVSRKPDVLERAAAELSAETGRAVLGIAADVRDPDALGRAVAATVEKFGGLDTLVNGAAGNFLAPAATLSPNGFKTVIDIDLLGTFHAS